MVTGKKHKPPSKIRYAENHPSVTIHLTKDEYNDLWEMSLNNGKSMNQMLKEAVGLVRKGWKKYLTVFEEGMESGYKDAIKDFSRNLKCSSCGRSFQIDPKLDDKIYKWLVEKFNDVGWRHQNCRK